MIKGWERGNVDCGPQAPERVGDATTEMDVSYVTAALLHDVLTPMVKRHRVR